MQFPNPPNVAVLASATVIITSAVYFIYGSIFRSTNGFATAKGGLPLVGHTFLSMKPKQFRITLSAAAGHDTAANVSVFGSNTLCVFGYDSVKWAFGKVKAGLQTIAHFLVQTGTLLNSRWFPRWIALLGLHSVPVVNDLALHKRLRGLAGQSFTKEILLQCYPQLCSTVHKTLTEMSMKDQTYVYEHSKQFTYTAIILFVFGAREVDIERMQLQKDNFTTLVNGLLDFILPEWMNGPFGRAMKARNAIVRMVKQIMSERESEQAALNDGLSKLMDATNDDGETLTEDEIADNIVALVFAGNDSTGATISSGFYFLVNEMDPQERAMLEEEIRSAPANIDMSLLLALPVLDAFIRELLRIKSPIGGAMREIASDNVTIMGRPMKKHSAVMIANPALGFDEDVFPEPEKFKLSRFLNTDSKNDLSSRYMPFGHGSRQCLGMALARLERVLDAPWSPLELSLFLTLA
ncbi:hypothetical protein HDU83_004677 [Entophlyctis luteolus]|nr:hypothetical protein HDU83_004677 [Entophlyctis luteolus]